ncbi:hypothetical protein [Cognatiluteimonas profundi]|uniref:hypothetical protein n=1 Tax=Cognatiluteimonas profundi TaxID=2594501 RepID=UPI00131E75E2|nr:hypothetical protein [Lysobacter profundi]
MALEIIPVWKQVTPELKAELLAMWEANQAMRNPAQAAVRADQAVCIARDEEGRLCAVGTAVLRVLPRLRQPMYYYRQFFATEVRGQKQTAPFFERACSVLQKYNAGLDKPESLGVLLELQNPQLAARYNSAQGDKTVFIGYSPRGFQLRVSYFEGATLLPPVDVRRNPMQGIRQPGAGSAVRRAGRSSAS